MDIVLNIWLVVLVLLSLLPLPSEEVPAHSDKVFHFLAYFITAALIYFKLRESKRRALLISVVLSILLGSVLEILQGMIPGRTPSWWDFSANTAGAISFCIIAVVGKNQGSSLHT